MGCVADVGILESVLSSQNLRRFEKDIRNASLLLVDGNLKEDVLLDVCRIAAKSDTPIIFEPVSPFKAVRCLRYEKRDI